MVSVNSCRQKTSERSAFYHLLAENPENYYVAYVSEQNLVEDGDNGPVGHPEIATMFTGPTDGLYKSKAMIA